MKNKPLIKIKFMDFWPVFKDFENDFYEILSKKYEIKICDDPDFVIYSVHGHEHLEYDCIRIFYTAENIIPDFNICDYGIGFANIDFGDRYARVPLYSLLHYKTFSKNASKLYKQNIDKKEKFCDFIYSNKRGDKKREEFYSLLSEYKKIDSGGRYLNNIGGPVEDKFEFQKKYKFSIAFENSSDEGYTTEKIVEAKAAGTIPIYWGDPNVSTEFNAESFINCHDYDDFSEVIEEVKRIDSNDALFDKYQKAPFFNDDNLIEQHAETLEKFLFEIIDNKRERKSKSQATLRYIKRIKEAHNKHVRRFLKLLRFFRKFKR